MVMNYLFSILIFIVVIYFVTKLLDYGVSRFSSALFETDSEQFELIKVSTHYSNSGVELYKSLYIL